MKKLIITLCLFISPLQHVYVVQAMQMFDNLFAAAGGDAPDERGSDHREFAAQIRNLLGQVAQGAGRRFGAAMNEMHMQAEREQEGEVGEGVNAEDQILAELVELMRGYLVRNEERFQRFEQRIDELDGLVPALREMEEFRATQRRLRNAVEQLEITVRRLENRLAPVENEVRRQRGCLSYLLIAIFGGLAGVFCS